MAPIESASQAPLPEGATTLQTGEIDREDIKERQRQDYKNHADHQVEDRRRLQRTEEAACNHGGQAQYAIGQRYAQPVYAAQPEARGTGAALRTGSDNRQVYWNHR